MRTLILSALLLPVAACAQSERCKHSDPRTLQLDFSNVRTVSFEIGPNELRLEASSGAEGAIEGRACASHADYIDQLTLTQEKVDDRLIVRAEREDEFTSGLFGKHYARMHLAGSVPDDVVVELNVGSGDGRITGASQANVIVGSGDAEIRQTGGPVTATVGSGDIEITDAEQLQVGAIGSGDVEAQNIRGAATVGNIGSGDFELENASGDAEIGSIGSGDAELRDIDGSVTVGTVGSGDVDAHNIRGDLTVRSIGSGSIEHSNIDGTVSIPGRR